MTCIRTPSRPIVPQKSISTSHSAFALSFRIFHDQHVASTTSRERSEDHPELWSFHVSEAISFVVPGSYPSLLDVMSRLQVSFGSSKASGVL